jgi:seryl-tRNA synthetase
VISYSASGGLVLDPKFVVENLERVQEAIASRGGKADLDGFASIDKDRRATLKQVEDLRHLQRQKGEEIARLGREGKDASGEKAAMKGVATEIKELESRLEILEGEVRERLLLLPNVPDDSVPVGPDPDANQEVRRHGEIRVFDFQPKSHWDLGLELGILDFERAARVSGARFAFYFGWGARLERALIQFMLDLHTVEKGYKEVIPPYLVNANALVGTGQLPKFEADLFKTHAGDRELYLIPTSEVPLTNIHAQEILEKADLPKKYVAFSPCFRSEAGSYGKDVRGLIRNHQFHKVELVKFSAPESSMEELESMVSDAEEVLKRLELPYRVVVLSTEAMGFSSAKTYDIEVFLPGQGAYREISSCTNCTDFQARRAAIRYRPEPGAKPRFCHTLNGSGLAVGRTFIALLENHQQKDGSIRIPEALRPYLSGAERFGH